MSHIPGWANVISTANSFNTGATSHTGTYENIPQPWVGITVAAPSQSGTITVNFSHDGTTAHSTITKAVTAGVGRFVPLLKLARYVRVSWTSAIAPTSFSLQTSYGIYAPGISSIGNTILDDDNASLVRAVISGVGHTNAKVTDHYALQVTPPPEAKSAFGEAMTAELDPVIQITFPYAVNPLLIDCQNKGGSSTVAQSMLVLSTGAGANQYSKMSTVRRVKYHAGQGIRARFTALFTTGVANSTQIVGIGSDTEFFGFGYNGATFGILRRYGGQREIRTLTVTTASTTAENITITLDGNSDTTVAVTNSGNTTTTANEIAANDYSNVGTGWTARAVGNTVVFVARDSQTHTGSYSLSAATTAVGSFAQTLAGVVPTEVWVSQSDWNGDDTFDGSGLSGVTLDPTKGNVFQVDFQYLGFGLIRFFVGDPDDGEFHNVHSMAHSNANTRPSLDNPSMSLHAAAINAANTSDVILKTASVSGFIDGKRSISGVNRGVKRAATISASGDTPITSIRVSEVFQSKQNRTEIKLNYVSCAVDHSQPVAINFIANPTLTGASWSAIGASTSAVYQDTSATAYSGGVFLFSVPLGKSANQIVDLKDQLELGKLGPGDILTLSVEYSSGTNAAVRVAINFNELF